MPRVMVYADCEHDREPVMVLAERVRTDDVASDHFADQLIERLGWALADAEAIELETRLARGLAVSA